MGFQFARILDVMSWLTTKPIPAVKAAPHCRFSQYRIKDPNLI